MTLCDILVLRLKNWNINQPRFIILRIWKSLEKILLEINCQHLKGSHKIDPLKNIVNEILFVEATSLELEEAVALADAAFPIYREMSGAQRTSFLNAIADEILNLGDALIDI